MSKVTTISTGNDVAYDQFFVTSNSTKNVRRDSLENEIESEVSRFLFNPDTSNNMLHEYPNIKEIYFKFNTTLSSSAAVELVFSQTALIFTPHRNRFSAEIFEKTLPLKYNHRMDKVYGLNWLQIAKQKSIWKYLMIKCYNKSFNYNQQMFFSFLLNMKNLKII